jgi:hypothetical protein
MTNWLCGMEFPEKLLNYLHEMGLPKHINSFKLECKGGEEPIEIECSFTAYENDKLVIENDEVKVETKTYRLIEFVK